MSNRTGRIQTFKDARGEWRWRLRAANGRIVAQGESHATQAKAQRAAVGVLRAALDAATTIAQELLTQ
jgi:uncharacterized protein YegP (UPF0339 family)